MQTNYVKLFTMIWQSPLSPEDCNELQKTLDNMVITGKL